MSKASDNLPPSKAFSYKDHPKTNYTPLMSLDPPPPNNQTARKGVFLQKHAFADRICIVLQRHAFSCRKSTFSSRKMQKKKTTKAFSCRKKKKHFSGGTWQFQGQESRTQAIFHKKSGLQRCFDCLWGTVDSEMNAVITQID